MKKSNSIRSRILKLDEVKQEALRLRLKSKTIALITGDFDVLNESNVTVLAKAASFADVLFVGIVSDASLKKDQGENHSHNDENARAFVVASLVMVDNVVVFDEGALSELIKLIRPDVLVKSNDQSAELAMETKEVLAAGGKVETVSPEEESL
ncbi:MAG: D-glycero-beta-D-manno-heptose 1-phosphate adenylyltransferase [Ginsengibacter sp.]